MAVLWKSLIIILFLFSGDVGAEGVETLVDGLVAAVDLVDVIDAGGPFGAHGGDEQGYACADVRAGHIGMTQFVLAVDADDGGAVRVAEDDLRTHIDELVDKEETRLEHLLMDEDDAACLGGSDEEDGQKVGREARPGCVGNGHDGAIDERVDLIMVVGWYIEVVAALFDGDAETTEGIGNDSEVGHRDVGDGEFGARHGSHTDE